MSQISNETIDKAKSGDRAARDAIIVQSMGAIRRLAGYKARGVISLDEADLYGAGAIGVMKAIKRYSTSFKVLFETYAFTRINGEMIDELRRTDAGTRRTRVYQRRLRSVTDSLGHSLGRRPSEEELSEAIEISPSSVRQLQDGALIASPLSIDDLRDMGERLFRDKEPAQPGDTFPGGRLQGEEFWRHALKGLDQKSRLCVLMYYREGLTMKETAQQLGLSESRISQLLSSIREQLRDRLAA